MNQPGDLTRNSTVNAAASIWATLFMCGFILAVGAFGIFLIALSPPMGLTVIATAIIVPLLVRRRRRQNTRAQAETATQQAREYIRANYGREPRDDEEVYTVARQFFFNA